MKNPLDSLFYSGYKVNSRHQSAPNPILMAFLGLTLILIYNVSMVILLLKFKFEIDSLKPFEQLGEYAIAPYFLATTIFCGYRYFWNDKYQSIIALFENETDQERKIRILSNIAVFVLSALMFYAVLATGTTK